MSRKPIHLQAVGKLTPRDRIWAAVRALHVFDISAISDRVVADAPNKALIKRIPERTIETYLFQLRDAGFLSYKPEARNNKGRHQAAIFGLQRDPGIEAPRLGNGGRVVTQGSANASLWRAMRVLKRFNYIELLASVPADQVTVSKATAHSYCHYLARAGYLQVVAKAKPGTPASYLLVKYTGPLAPMIQRVKHVYDPNLGEVVWHPEVHS